MSAVDFTFMMGLVGLLVGFLMSLAVVLFFVD